ncbi:MAG: serine/threonine protein kinase [Candidatus Heimdallarchaeota archaeon]|nr:serine/threonine protein kinase [Candidatus Heimdallarchaeota archaeon]
MVPLSITQSFRDLSQFDFRILSVIEILMAKHEFVPVEEIARYLKYNEKKIVIFLKHLKKLKLVFIVQRHYLGSALTFIGYDALALKALVEKGILSQIGPEIGAGKESNVHLGMNDEGKEMIVKFHRLGKLDFRATRKSRSFVAEKRHLSPLYESRLSAGREYEALVHLNKAGVSVPKPIAQNRHLVCMEIISGQDLYRIKRNNFGSEEDISHLFHRIINEIKKCVEQGYIHGDLSEYNIRLDENDYPVLFDWPQYIARDEKQAEEILTRDFQNIISFFQKKFQVNVHYEISEILNLLIT